MKNTYVCTNKKCNHEDSTVIYRYRIQVTIMDSSGSISLMIWDTDAMSLIGKSANDLKEELLQNTGNDDDPSYPMELNNIL
ncbi:hypothetical protein P3S68_025153 [Capsicum galapagoense]